MDDEHGDLLRMGKGIAPSETGDRTRGPLLERSSPRRFDIIPRNAAGEDDRGQGGDYPS